MTSCVKANLRIARDFEGIASCLIIVLAIIGIIKEGFQLWLQRKVYFSLHNVISNTLDWFSYISAILVMLPLMDCGAKTEWQWQLGTFTLLFTWFDFILYLRRFPNFGIYVLMIQQVLKTSLKFLFALLPFLVAFSLSFFLLIQNQEPFGTGFNSIVKSSLMMIGEFDYGDIFFGENPVHFKGSTYAIFILFTFLVSIIVMNLLVGLAVDDVKELTLKANAVKLRMQIETSLEVELVTALMKKRFPWISIIILKGFSRRWYCAPKGDDKNESEYVRFAYDFVDGDLISLNAVDTSFENMKTKNTRSDLSRLQGKIIDHTETRFGELETRLEDTENMLKEISYQLSNPSQINRTMPENLTKVSG